jgi:ABC-type nitrate/sulfonate/bicarbonate transport system permease component
MWAAVVTAMALTGILLGLLALVERTVAPWSTNDDRSGLGTLPPIPGFGLRSRWREIWPALALLAALPVLWAWSISAFDVSAYVAPTPTAVLTALHENAGELATNGLVTIGEAGAGFLVGNVVAVALAVLFVFARPLRVALYPIALAVQAVPVVALAPILVVTVGPGYPATVLLAAFMTYPLTLVSIVKGFDTCPAEVTEVMHSLHASRTQLLTKALLPAALPMYLTSLKVGASPAIGAAISAEYIGSMRGLGFVIQDAQTRFQVPLLWAGVLVTGALGLACYWLCAQAQRLMPDHSATTDLER